MSLRFTRKKIVLWQNIIFGSFSVFLYLNEEETIQQVRLIKYLENEIPLSTSNKAKKPKKGAKT